MQSRFDARDFHGVFRESTSAVARVTKALVIAFQLQVDMVWASEHPTAATFIRGFTQADWLVKVSIWLAHPIAVHLLSFISETIKKACLGPIFVCGGPFEGGPRQVSFAFFLSPATIPAVEIQWDAVNQGRGNDVIEEVFVIAHEVV